VVFSEDEPSQTLVEFMDVSTKAKKREENDNDNIKNSLQNSVVMTKNVTIKENNKFKENNKEKDNKEDKGYELDIKYCPRNATLVDLLTKPLTTANIRKIRNMIKSIIGQQECVGEKLDYSTGSVTGTGSGTGTGTVIGSGSGTNPVLGEKNPKVVLLNNK
jgi:hypothetical protein